MEERSKTILIIEDDHDIRVALRQVLEEADFLVLSAANGAIALEVLRATAPPDLIFCDLKMPIMNGETFMKRKKEDPKLKDIPVIIISAQHEKFCRFPEVACLPKPLDMNKIIKCANELINRIAL